jgi:hypothetical protein
MIITKIFDIILNINSINDLFISDINNKIITLIENKYKYKCYLSSYILNINKIINRSLLECNQNDLNCSFNLSVQFEAECLIFIKNEVILNMKIHEIINNNIILKNDTSNLYDSKYNLNEIIIALIKNNSDMKIFKKNDIIPITVGKVKYTLGSDKITINAYPFIPIIMPNICYQINEINTNQFELLNDNILKYINIEEKRKEQILKENNNTWNYFKELLYPYKNKNYNTKYEYLLINDLVTNSNQYNNFVVTYDNIDLSESKLFIDKNAKQYIKPDSYITLYEICKNYYLYLKLLNDLSIKYNSKKLIDNYNNIFNLYTKYKK